MAIVGSGEIPRVLHGTSVDLGPHATRFPLEERTILHVLRAQAQERPDKVWLAFDGVDAYTFGEAQRLTNRVAAAIRETIGAGKHVALFMPNQPEFPLAEMGAMAAPGVAVPLNSDSRGPLLRGMIARADVAAIVVNGGLVEILEDLEDLAAVQLVVVTGDGELPETIHGVQVVRWDDWIAGRTEEAEAELPSYDDMAVIAFTSGTTGQAKGVVHTHHYWQLFSAIVTDSLERTPDDVLTSPLPIHHGGALHLIVNSSLHAGCKGTLQSRFSPSRFWDEVARDGATYGFLLGPLATMVAKATEVVPEHRMTSMYCLPCPPEVDKFEERFNCKILYQGWAMTEIFPMPMRPVMIEGVEDTSMGYAVPWMDYGVVDENDNMVPPGVQGELVWRSLIPHGMFSGYYKEPDKTLEAFANFWFHTGDAAIYDETGMLFFRGRMRDRIRRRGEMVTAAEVDYVALQHPDVLESAAYGVPAELGEEEVKLDLVLTSDISHEDMHDWLKKNLPKYMVPRYLEFVDEFPKTPSLRIEKYKLQQRPLDRPEVRDFDPRAAKTKA